MIEHKGRQYARVTEVLSPFSDFSHIDPEVLANKCAIGTAVHQAIADDIEGEFPSPGPKGLGYYQSYEAWRKHLSVNFVASEARYYDEDLMISGQIDALAMMGWVQDLPVLVDFKTSAQESKEVWPMQAHLYAHLLAKNGVKVRPRYVFVKLDKEGAFPMVYSYNFDPNVHARCLGAIEKYWSMSQSG